MSLLLSAVAATNIGLVRSNNEDSAFAGRRLIAVADGIGGLPAGELASEIVIRALRVLDLASRVGDPAGLLRATVEAANRRIRQVSDSDPAHEGMGTTVTALLLQGETLGLVHVGDSRCYLLRDGVLAQVTKDDTFVQTLVDEGMIRPEEVRFHPRRSLVTQAVQGHDYTATVEVLAPKLGDRFLLCSDGLSDMVTDEAIGSTLARVPDAADAADELILLALAAGGPDNITAVIADVVPE
jgi:serine/threonine protein phosphatase PrpC